MKIVIVLVGFCLSFMSYAASNVHSEFDGKHCEYDGHSYELVAVIAKGEAHFVCHENSTDSTAEWRPFVLSKE